MLNKETNSHKQQNDDGGTAQRRIPWINVRHVCKKSPPNIDEGRSAKLESKESFDLSRGDSQGSGRTEARDHWCRYELDHES